MPLVVVSYNPDFVTEKDRQTLGGLLQQIVASRLSCMDSRGKINPGGVEVRFTQNGREDVGTTNFGITILASEDEARLANQDERRMLIQHDLISHQREHSALSFTLCDDENFAWLLLAKGSFGRFESNMA